MTFDGEYFERHFSFDHPAMLECQWEILDHLRATCPVAHTDSRQMTGTRSGYWLLTRYEDVRNAAQDWKVFSSDHENTARYGLGPGEHLPPITSDPPLQRDFRGIIGPHLSPKAIEKLEGAIRNIATELIDQFIEDGRCDLVRQLSQPFMPQVFYRLLFGLSNAEVERTRAWRDAINFDPEDQGNVRALAEWDDWLKAFVAGRRTSPGRNDIVDGLLHGTVGGRPLTHEEITGVLRNLVLGAFPTTTRAINVTVLVLLERPELRAELRANPAYLPGLFDEILRFDAPIPALPRVCVRETMIGDQLIHAGEEVMLCFAAANRDPTIFSDPATFVADRPSNRHLSFGIGVHRCIGSNLARLGWRVLFEEFLSRVEDFEMPVGESPQREQSWRGGVGGWRSIPLLFPPGSRAREQTSLPPGSPSVGSRPHI
jgi:cytochrome P450